MNFRKIEYLSPTSYSIFREDPEKFYLSYLTLNRPPRPPQTIPMALGSAFDARIKSYLYEKLIGKDPRFELTALYDAQVERQNRDEVWQDSLDLFELYQKNGLTSLLQEMAGSLTAPRFEIEVKGIVERSIHEIPLLGKPDVFYINKQGCQVIVDWKVNGYYSKYDYSPKPGYINIYPDMKTHKSTMRMPYKGMVIGSLPMEDIHDQWANQLSVYSWLLGGTVGKETITAIDQLVGKKGKTRVAQFRAKVSEEYQLDLFDNIRKVWGYIQDEHIFQDLSKEDSLNRCKLLDAHGGPELF